MYFSPITVRVTNKIMFEWVKAFRIHDRNKTSTHSGTEIQRTGLDYIYGRVTTKLQKTVNKKV